MNEVRTAYLIAGGRPMDRGGTVRSHARALAECGRAKPRVAYLGVANGDSRVFFFAMKSLLQEAGAGEVKQLRLAREDADTEAAKVYLQAADAVYLAGGEVEDGMNWLIRHGLDGFLQELFQGGKLFFGMSAGSILMGTHWVHWDVENDDSTARLFPCLGFVPTVFDTHAEDEHWRELVTALRLLGPGARGYGIPSGGMISGTDEGALTELEKSLLHFVCRGTEVERLR